MSSPSNPINDTINAFATSSDGGLSVGAKAGIALAALIVTALILICILCVMRRKKQARKASVASTSSSSSAGRGGSGEKLSRVEYSAVSLTDRNASSLNMKEIRAEP